ncbi:MAG: peptidoglycan-binding protein [Clostridia bacterium]|nr:peptidoglycan-binding protein [Clostridia bacterium]
MITNKELLAIAIKQLGNTGSKYRKYVGVGGSWCDMFVFWLFDANGCGSLLTWTKNQRYYCPSSIEWCKKNLAMIPPYWAMECDLVYYDWDRNGRPNHIGIVEKNWTNQKIHAIEGNTSGGKVARKDRKNYIQAVFRPHFKPSVTLKNKSLSIDGVCGNQTVAGIQRALKILGYYKGSIDGILGRKTMMALQAWAGCKQDAQFGPKTAKAIQKKLSIKQDGDFYIASTKALQKWVNAIAYQKKSASKPATTPKVNAKAQAAVNWGRKIIKSGKYKYKKWNNKKKNTKLCPICHPGSGNGWNCIGFVSACFYHGAGVKDVTCSCSGIGTDSFFTKVTLASWQKRNGKNWTMITNGGSKGGADIPASKLLAGDVLICYDAKGKFKHIAIFSGNGKIIESTKTRTPNVGERTYKDLCGRHHVTRAFRYIG